MSSILTLQPHPPVETLSLGDRTGELELREHHRDRGSVEPGLADEPIDVARFSPERLEHASRRLAELCLHGSRNFHAE